MLQIEYKNFIRDKCKIALIEIVEVVGSSPREMGSWMLVSDKSIFNTIGGGTIEFEMIKEARKLLELNFFGKKIFESKLNPKIDQCCGGRIKCQISLATSDMLQKVEKKINNEISKYNELYLFGGGHVGKAILQLSSHLPVKVTVTDSRNEIIESLKIQFKKYSKTIKFNTDVFPERIIPTSNLRGAFLVMTHSHANDFNIIEELLRYRSKNYIGMIGSKTKKLALKKYLIERNFDEKTVDLVHCPIGRKATFESSKRPEVIAALVISDIIASFKY